MQGSVYLIEDENKKMRIMENEHFKQESYLDDNGKTILEKNVEDENLLLQSLNMSKTEIFIRELMIQREIRFLCE